MENGIDKEIRGLKSDERQREVSLSGFKNSFELELLNGMGERMVQELKEPKKQKTNTSNTLTKGKVILNNLRKLIFGI